ncbi:hypothetical protein [Endozoicomonas sp.]|uniref:hypothetical protein n=1 Tax=Endozoicomonas sp. TaxID=1892382 RepID=UPI00383ADB5C
MMNRSMVLIVLSLYAFIFYPSAGASEIYRLVEPSDTVTQPVEVGLRMVSCGGSQLFRCARITMQMSPEAYDLLGQPKEMAWSYIAVGVSIECRPFVGFLSCHHNNMNVSSSAKIVYDATNDEYHSLQTGGTFKSGVGFMLTSVCLQDGAQYNCQKVYLVRNSYKDDYVFKTVYFNSLSQLSISTL